MWDHKFISWTVFFLLLVGLTILWVISGRLVRFLFRNDNFGKFYTYRGTILVWIKTVLILIGILAFLAINFERHGVYLLVVGFLSLPVLRDAVNRLFLQSTYDRLLDFPIAVGKQDGVLKNTSWKGIHLAQENKIVLIPHSKVRKDGIIYSSQNQPSKINILVSPLDESGPFVLKEKLYESLMSSPFLDEKPRIAKKDNGFEINLVLTNKKHTDGVIEKLRELGILVRLNEK